MKRLLLFPFLILLSFALFGQDSVNVTFHLNMRQQTVDPGGVYLAGGSGFGVAGDNEMTDPDGDGVYSITLRRPKNWGSDYTFLNGNCGDWSCKEQIGGQSCAVPPWNDRHIDLGVNDTTVSTCFSVCSTDTSCTFSATVNITFNVNMRNFTVDTSGVYLAGGAGFGVPGENEMTDPDGDGIYSITIEKPANFASHYTFLNGNCGDWSCKEQIGGQPCADPNNFDDRYLALGTNDTTINTCFQECTDDTMCAALSIDDPVFDKTLFFIQSNPVSQQTTLVFSTQQGGTRKLAIFDIQGRRVWSEEISGQQTRHELSVTSLKAGMYLVNLRQGGKLGTRRMIVVD